MREVVEPEIAARRSDLASLRRKDEPERAPDHMLEGTLRKHQVRSAKPVVLIARKHGMPIDIGSTQRRLKVKREEISRGCDRLRHQKASANAAFQIARKRRLRTRLVQPIAAIVGTLIHVHGALLLPPIDRELMVEVQSESAEREGRARSDKLLQHSRVVKLGANRREGMLEA